VVVVIVLHAYVPTHTPHMHVEHVVLQVCQNGVHVLLVACQRLVVVVTVLCAFFTTYPTHMHAERAVPAVCKPGWVRVLPIAIQ